MTILPQKTCTRCHESKDLDLFHKDKGKRDGHSNWCKACQSAYDRSPERMAKKNEYNKRQYAEDPAFKQAMIERASKHYVENRENVLVRVKEWQKENKERVNEGARRRYHAYQGAKDSIRKATPEHRAKKREQQKRRLQDPIAKEKQRWSLMKSKYKRRAQIEQSGTSFTKEEWEDLCRRYDHRCLRCGEQKKLTVDHIIPLSMGGSNDISNIQPLCRLCNTSKNDTYVDYRPNWEPLD